MRAALTDLSNAPKLRGKRRASAEFKDVSARQQQRRITEAKLEVASSLEPSGSGAQRQPWDCDVQRVFSGLNCDTSSSLGLDGMICGHGMRGVR